MRFVAVMPPVESSEGRPRGRPRAFDVVPSPLQHRLTNAPWRRPRDAEVGCHVSLPSDARHGLTTSTCFGEESAGRRDHLRSRLALASFDQPAAATAKSNLFHRWRIRRCEREDGRARSPEHGRAASGDRIPGILVARSEPSTSEPT
jgi:hypothetical protein